RSPRAARGFLVSRGSGTWRSGNCTCRVCPFPEHLKGTLNYRPGYAGYLRHVNPVRRVGSSLDNLAQEGDPVAVLAHAEAEIFEALQAEVGKFMVVGSKQGAGTEQGCE